MLSKPATVILGFIYEQPLNAYELIKTLHFMNVKQWYEIANSTVYATIKTLEKKSYLVGTVQKDGNMPDKTIYSITHSGIQELKITLKGFIEDFNYDLTYFMIAAFFLDFFEIDEQLEILNNRLKFLKKTKDGIELKLKGMEKLKLPTSIIHNVFHNKMIVQLEIDTVIQFIDITKKKG